MFLESVCNGKLEFKVGSILKVEPFKETITVNRGVIMLKYVNTVQKGHRAWQGYGSRQIQNGMRGKTSLSRLLQGQKSIKYDK